MRHFESLVVVAALTGSACDPPASLPSGSREPNVADVTVQPSTRATPDSAPKPEASSAPSEAASCFMLATMDRERTYCFQHENHRALEAICTQFDGTFSTEGACPPNHVGTCLLDDGTVRRSYAPATTAIAKKQCAVFNGPGVKPPSRFLGPDEPIPNLPTKVHACDARKERNACVQSKYASDTGRKRAKMRCLAGEHAQSCPTEGRVGTCFLLTAGIVEHIYDLTPDAAREACLGTYIPSAP